MSDLSDARLSEIRALIKRHKHWDKVFAIVGLAAMLVGVITLIALFVDLAIDGVPRLTWDFFTSFPSRRASEAGILSAWVGTTLVMLVTMLAAVPLGVAAGIYLEEYAPRNWMTDLIEINVTNLAGVPSIVYGLLALGLFVYGLGFGQSILAAGLTLALLILPVVIVATRESIRAIPSTIREGSYAVGATKWQTVRDHVLPYSTGGILTGIIIGLARAIGETAPVITIGALTFIAFLPPSPVKSEFPWLSFDWLFAPFTLMPIQMFNWVSRPQKEFQLNAAAAGLILMAMTLLMNGVAIYIRYKFRKRIRW
jgi:phosphate transport system permease protein